MVEEKVFNSFVVAIMSVVFASLMFNLFIRNEYDFRFLIIETRDIYSIALLEKQQVIQYIVINRIKQLLVVLVLFKAFGVEKICNVFVVLFGGLIGLFVSCQVYYVGLLGLVIILLYMLPHGLIYAWGMYYSYKAKMFYVKEDVSKKLVIFMMIFVLGVIVECVFMTFFLKNFYQHMVT